MQLNGNNDNYRDMIQPGEETSGAGDYYTDRPSPNGEPVRGAYNPSMYQAPGIRKGPGNSVIIILIAMAVAFVVFLFVLSTGDSYKPGKTTGNTYKSEYFGINIHFDSEMIVQGYAGKESRVLYRLKNKKEVVTETQGQNLDGSKELTFDVKYMDKSIEDMDMSEDEVAESLKDSFVGSLADPEYNVKVEDETATMGGKLRKGFILTASGGGESAYIGQFYFFKGHYAAVLTVYAPTKTVLRTMLEWVS